MASSPSSAPDRCGDLRFSLRQRWHDLAAVDPAFERQRAAVAGAKMTFEFSALIAPAERETAYDC
jgi:hypothetical protein